METAGVVETSLRPLPSSNVTRRLALAGTIPYMDAMTILAAVGLFWRGSTTSLVLGVLIFCLLVCSGSQRLSISPRLERDIPTILACIGVPFVAIAVFVAKQAPQLESVTKVAAATVVLVVVGRAVAYRVIRAARVRGWAVEPTLIVGAGEVGELLASALHEHGKYGLSPVGFLDSFDGVGSSMPILGDASALPTIAQRNKVTKVIVAFGAMGEADMVEILRACDRLQLEIYVVPRFFELAIMTGRNRCDDVWGIPLVRLRRSAGRAAARRTKRMFDIVVASGALVVASPIFLVAALAVHLSTPGPVFLRQRRVGQDGRVFELLKFRSMVVNDQADTTWLASAEYMTPVGRFLRRTSLDELPQLLNVLRGDMSLVGPRPERPYFASRFMAEVRRYNDRHRVPAGITGWAQVHGLKGDTPIPDRVRFDNYYIEHWSLWRDVVIVLQTIAKLLTLR